MIGAVVEEYLCFEPNPVLAEIAAGRHITTATRQIASAEQLAAAEVDVVVCCGSLHHLLDVASVLDDLSVADGGWLWVAETCEVTSATLASAAVLNPGLLSVEPFWAADQWWRFIAQHRWQPAQMTQDGPGLTIVARRQQSLAPTRRAPRATIAPSLGNPERTYVVDESVLAVIAAIWQRHLNSRRTFCPPPPTISSCWAVTAWWRPGSTPICARRASGKLALVDLFNYPVLGELVAHAGARTSPQPTHPRAVEPYDETEFPLTVVQHAYLAGREGGFMLSGVAAHCYFEFQPSEFDRSRFEAAARHSSSIIPDCARRSPQGPIGPMALSRRACAPSCIRRRSNPWPATTTTCGHACVIRSSTLRRGRESTSGFRRAKTGVASSGSAWTTSCSTAPA